MCGIVAMAGRVDSNCLDVMNGLLIHRGPDSAGYWFRAHNSDVETTVA